MQGTYIAIAKTGTNGEGGGGAIITSEGAQV